MSASLSTTLADILCVGLSDMAPRGKRHAVPTHAHNCSQCGSVYFCEYKVPCVPTTLEEEQELICKKCEAKL